MKAVIGYALLWALYSTTGSAKTCEEIRADSSVPSQTKLALLLRQGCLGGAEDQSAAVVGMRKAIDALPSLEDTERRLATVDVVSAIEAQLLAGATTEKCRPDLHSAVESVKAALLSGMIVPDSPQCATKAISPTCWDPDTFGDLRVPALPSCTGDTSNELFLASAVLMRDALGGNLAPALKAYGLAAARLRGRWWSYFHETRRQYPWEVMLNGACYARVVRNDTSRFHDPPSHQWTVLHPGVALEVLEDAPDGEQLKPGVSVELLGYNRWTWRDERPARGLGASVVVNYADVPEVPDWRLGVAVHVRHRYTFGATRANGSTGYFVSTDLAKWAQDKKAAAERFLDKVKAKAGASPDPP